MFFFFSGDVVDDDDMVERVAKRRRKDEIRSMVEAVSPRLGLEKEEYCFCFVVG